MSRQEEKLLPGVRPSIQLRRGSCGRVQMQSTPGARRATSVSDSEQRLVCEQVQPPAFCSATFGTGRGVGGWSVSEAKVSNLRTGNGQQQDPPGHP